MDVPTTRVALKRAMDNMWRARFPEKGVENHIPGFDERMARLRALNRRLLDHGRRKIGLQKHRSNLEKFLDQLYALKADLANGARVLALDTEWNRRERVHEVGYTTYQNGIMETRCIHVTGFDRKRTHFDFGEPEELSWEETKARLIAEVTPATYLSGHSLANDFDILAKNDLVLPHRLIYDTLWFSRLPTHHEGLQLNPSLVTVATHFGIDASRPHSSGNDSRYTMEVLLAMVNRVEAWPYPK